MTDGYAILGWGSLIWDLDNLAPHVAEDWRMADGPHLPMEFTRVSPKRKMGLAVCLDPVDGVACPTHAIRSTRANLADARADLAARERAPVDGVGAVCQVSQVVHGRTEISEVVLEWCVRTGRTGAVWTDLTPNYAERRGEAFTVSRAMAYLRSLSGESLDEAVRYIENAPAATDTPLRRALAREAWWRVEAARVASQDAR